MGQFWAGVGPISADFDQLRPTLGRYRAILRAKFDRFVLLAPPNCAWFRPNVGRPLRTLARIRPSRCDFVKSSTRKLPFHASWKLRRTNLARSARCQAHPKVAQGLAQHDVTMRTARPKEQFSPGAERRVVFGSRLCDIGRCWPKVAAKVGRTSTFLGRRLPEMRRIRPKPAQLRSSLDPIGPALDQTWLVYDQVWPKWAGGGPEVAKARPTCRAASPKLGQLWSSTSDRCPGAARSSALVGATGAIGRALAPLALKS